VSRIQSVSATRLSIPVATFNRGALTGALLAPSDDGDESLRCASRGAQAIDVTRKPVQRMQERVMLSFVKVSLGGLTMDSLRLAANRVDALERSGRITHDEARAMRDEIQRYPMNVTTHQAMSELCANDRTSGTCAVWRTQGDGRDWRHIPKRHCSASESNVLFLALEPPVVLPYGFVGGSSRHLVRS
jgi:hypothetical protein